MQALQEKQKVIKGILSILGQHTVEYKSQNVPCLRSVNKESVLNLSAGIAKPEISPFIYTQKPNKIKKSEVTELHLAGTIFHSDVGHFFQQISDVNTFTKSFGALENFLRTPKNSALFYAEIRMEPDNLQSKLKDYFSNDQIRQLLQSVPPINVDAQQLLNNMTTHDQIQQLLSNEPTSKQVQQLLNNIPGHKKVNQLLNDGLLTSGQIKQLLACVPTDGQVQQLLDKSGIEDGAKQQLLTNIITKEELTPLITSLPEDKIFIPKTSGRTLLKMITPQYGKIGIGEFFPDFGFDINKQIWDLPSEIYASRCSGEVLVVGGNVVSSEFDNTIWERREKPALLKNKEVTVIVEVKPECPDIPVRLVLPNGLQKARETHKDILSNLVLSTQITQNDILVLDFGMENIQPHNYNIEGQRTVIIPVKIEDRKLIVDQIKEMQFQQPMKNPETELQLEPPNTPVTLVIPKVIPKKPLKKIHRSITPQPKKIIPIKINKRSKTPSLPPKKEFNL